MASTPILPLAVWQSGTNQNSIPANDNSLRLEVLNREIISQVVTDQPASPADGDTYIIAATHTGAQWASLTPKDLAIFKGGTWYGFAPVEGIVVNVAGSLFKYDGGAWVSASGGAGTWGSITGTLSAQTDLQAALDAKATTAYVDNLLQGLSWKKAVRAATTANGTLATAYENGDSIDGVTLATGDRILLKNQTTASENGIYTVNASGAPTRATDADTGAEMVNATVFISEGSTLADTQWTCSTNAPITLGSTSLTFAQLSGGTGFANPMTTAGDIIIGGASGAPQRLAATTNGWVLTLVSGAPAWAAPGGGSLANWAEAINSATPNATIPVVSFSALSGTTYADAAIVPKGINAALLTRIPDNTTAGGNKRGSGSVDLQFYTRTAADQVASGAQSVIGGGSQNKASGTSSVVPGGSANTASGTGSFAVGASNTVSANYGSALGVSNSVTGTQGATAIGASNAASGLAALALGGTCSAAGDYSLATGVRSTSRGIQGARVHSSYDDGGSVGATPVVQHGIFNLGGTSSSATPIVLTANHNNALAAGNSLTCPTFTTMMVKGTVLARGATPFDSSSWEFTAQVTRDGANIAIVGTPVITPQFSTAGASGWTFGVSVNTTTQCLVLTCTGVAALSIRWGAVLQTVEVTRT